MNLTTPDTKLPIEKRLRRVGIDFLKPWYDRRVKTNQVRHVMVRNRHEEAQISVLNDPETLSAFDKKPNVDLAAWNDQMKGHETKYSQSEAAALMEEFSPATVLDKILSRRWGIAQGDATPPVQKERLLRTGKIGSKPIRRRAFPGARMSGRILAGIHRALSVPIVQAQTRVCRL